MNFQLIPQAAFMAMIIPTLYVPTTTVLQTLDPAFTWDPSVGQPFHGLCCTSACVLPTPAPFLLPGISHALTPPPPYLSTFLNIGCVLECPGEL